MILTKHSLTVEANCPVDDTLDVYSVTVETHELIGVETILDLVKSYTRKPVHQEALTGNLARVGNAIDSWLFLMLAFGSEAFFAGNFVGKLEAIAVGVALTASRRRLVPVAS